MTKHESLRAHVVDAAAEVFAERGYRRTTIGAVARAAGISTHKVRKVAPDKAGLLALVLAQKLPSEAADLVAAAASAPAATPPLAAMLEAIHAVFQDPGKSWAALELETMATAAEDDGLRAVLAERVLRRWENVASVTAQTRADGSLDADVSDEAFAYFALALSSGAALIRPVVPTTPDSAAWDALVARIGSAIAPAEFLLSADHQAHQPWRLRIDIPDRPGGLARLIRALSPLHIYAVAMQVVGGEDGVRTIDLALTAPDQVSADAVLAAAMSAGTNGYLTEGSTADALDLPTRVLDAATAVVADPDVAPQTAAALVEADQLEVTDAVEGADDRAGVLRLQWTPDQHVVLHRDWAPFARAERTRASALLRLSAAVAALAGNTEALGWIEPIKGGRVWIRLGTPDDAEAVAAMHERCSEQSRYQRYFSTREWRDVQLSRLSGGHRGATLVVMSETGAVIGLGNVFPDDPGQGGTAELALIIEDAYHGRGVGTRLLRRMLHLAVRLGFTEVVASVLADNASMLRLLDDTSLEWSSRVEDGVRILRAPLVPRLGR